MLKIVDIKCDKRQCANQQIDKFIQLMDKYHICNLDLLPTVPWYEVSFTLKHSYAGFANAIRRVLIEELPTKCLTCTADDVQTDDPFILSDIVIKNIHLIPISQELTNYSYKTIALYVYNNTDEIIDIKAKHIITSDKPFSKIANDILHLTSGGKKSSFQTCENIIPNANIIIARLRPTKYIKITNLVIEEGIAQDNAAKFTLLNNVSYDILDQCSIEHDPTMFKLKFSTSSNIRPATVVQLLYNVLSKKIQLAKDFLIEYDKSNKKTYYTENFEVLFQYDIYTYKFHGEYITLVHMLAQQCYILEPTILYCAPTIDRYDNDIAMIKINHPTATKLLLKACDKCLGDLETLYRELYQKIKT